MLTAENILQATRPEDLFSHDALKEEYRKLALKWHPDTCDHPNCKDVFIQLDKLYKIGIDKISKGYWNFNGALRIESLSGHIYNIKYKYHEEFELGSMYISDNVLTYTVSKDYRKLYNNFIEKVSKFEFPNAKSREQMSKCLPSIKLQCETKDYLVLCINKTPEVVPLSLLIKYFGGSIDPKHGAWIMSTLHNMLCFLHFNSIAHNDISTSTYFVSPKFHSGLLLGGWWYTSISDSKLLSVPARTYGFMSIKDKEKKTTNKSLNGELARDVCREVLGDSSGVRLVSKFKVPKPFSDWIRLPGGNAIQDYSVWQDVLTESFGPRKFIEMKVDYNKIFKED